MIANNNLQSWLSNLIRSFLSVLLRPMWITLKVAYKSSYIMPLRYGIFTAVTECSLCVGGQGRGRDAGSVSVYKTLHYTRRLVESQYSNFNILFPAAFLDGAVMSLSCSPKLDNI